MAKAEAQGGAEKPTKKKKTFKKRGEKRVVHHGFVHVQASFNNTLITITDAEGAVVSWSSAGAIGFKGSRKGTPFAATQAAVAADLHQPLDVERNLLAEIAFDAALLLEHAADLAHVVLGQILDPDVRADAGRTENVARPFAADAVDIREPDLDPLGAREINACNTRHRLSLPLFVLRVRADHAHHTAAADDLALVANSLH